MTVSLHADNTNQKSVLIVSETQVNRIVVSRIVESTGMKTLAVAAVEALDLLQQQSFALVVIDSSPVMAVAVDVINRLSAGHDLAQLAKPPIIFLSATKDLPEGIESGAIDAVVSKPLTQERLETEVLRLVNEVRYC